MVAINATGGCFPDPLGPFTTTPLTLSTTGTKAAYMVNFPITGTMTHVGVYITSSVNSALTVRLETVSNVNGQPTGNLMYANGTGTQDITAGIANHVWIPVNGGTGVNVQQGDLVAIMVQATIPGPVLTVASSTISIQANNGLMFPTTLVSNSAGTAWANSGTLPPVCLFKYGNDIRFPALAFPHVTTASTAITGVSTPSTLGNRFILPFDCMVKGMWWCGAGNADFNYAVYDSDGITVLVSGTVNGLARSTNSVIDGTNYLTFSSSIRLKKDTYYRVVLTGIGSTGVTIRTMECALDGVSLIWTQSPTWGRFQQTSATTVVNEASWTQSTTKIVRMGLYIESMEFPLPINQSNTNGGLV